ncbi:glycine--tRNA ligase subunit beta [Sutterella sp.]|uniref:glycine--tRNA ligase subunit beta n=1 Tax=Sutterella sp. TaxID=1981025 RepID=UPI0026E0E922|nr:glycine--tRNA ligase subunit beta [Sutterella sp.]MDO5531027.1 glycine--tRNA ligase subunit beta [Sutterella sp.]
MTNLLVELQTEELPPKALRKLSDAFAEGVRKSLEEGHFLEASSQVKAYGAPRRLAVHITDVRAKSPDETFRQKLVPVKVGIAADGSATPALVKKMAALGITCDVAKLERVSDGKNEQLVYEGVRPGVELAPALQKALDYAVKHLPIPKVMTYQLADGETTVSFVRPVRYLTALYGAEIVPVELFGLKSGRTTRGHRFHAPEPVEIPNADAYESVMNSVKVNPSFDARRDEIKAQLEERAAALSATAIMPEDLLEEVTALTEWPVIYESTFEKEFLSVPEECLILTMQLNQKYFALRDAEGKLMNRFLLVSQLVAKDGGKAISEGNARVVRARLADAKFFYDQDQLHTLESRVEGLEHVVYHNKLGSQHERMLRVRAIAGGIADLIGADRTQAERAATLAKADLRTLMVGEFPELQGIMGEYYARHDGEPADVALAIREHYQPRYAGDELPSTPVSLAVALADKLETLVGLFGIGQLPTGEKDPFALRRHALGVLRMLIEKQLDVSLPEMIDAAWAAEQTVAGVTDNRAALLEFFADRLRVMLRDRGASAQEADAILALNPAKLADIPARVAALQAFMQLPEAESLTAANKRIGNILRKAEGVVESTVNESLLTEAEERALFAALTEVEPKAEALYAEGRFEDMLVAIAALRAPVDAFFEKVMVNAEDPALRANRLALLSRLYGVMNRVAEIARLAK